MLLLGRRDARLLLRGTSLLVGSELYACRFLYSFIGCGRKLFGAGGGCTDGREGAAIRHFTVGLDFSQSDLEKKLAEVAERAAPPSLIRGALQLRVSGDGKEVSTYR